MEVVFTDSRYVKTCTGQRASDCPVKIEIVGQKVVYTVLEQRAVAFFGKGIWDLEFWHTSGAFHGSSLNLRCVNTCPLFARAYRFQPVAGAELFGLWIVGKC